MEFPYMVAKAKVSVSDRPAEAIFYWLAQVGFDSFAYRLARLPISRSFLLWTFVGVFVLV
ncbi:MAG: hypothetical protein ACJAZW_002917 [Maritalea sp.]|jgi:hypothetical protein